MSRKRLAKSLALFIAGLIIYLLSGCPNPAAPGPEVPPITLPKTPGGLTVGSPTSDSLEVSWDSVAGALTYQLFRSTAVDGTFTQIYSGTARSFADSGLSSGTIYYYKIQSSDAGGSSTLSLAKSGLTKPSAPTLTVTNPTESTLTVSWIPINGAGNYQVYSDKTTTSTFDVLEYSGTETSFVDRDLSANKSYNYKAKAWNGSGYSALSGAASGTTTAAAATPPATPTGLAVDEATDDSITLSWNSTATATSYQVYRDNVLEYDGSSPVFTDTGLEPGTSYSYEVRATNSKGSSALSAPVTGTTLPEKPGGLVVGSPTTGSLTISWNTVIGAATYQLHRSTTASGTYSVIYTGAVASRTDTGLSSGVTYYYKVQAINSTGGSSGLSGYASGTTTATVPAPGAPSVGGATSSTLHVSWAGTGADGYVVYRDTNQYGTYATEAYSGTGTSFTDAGLTPNAVYYYRSKARIGSSFSAFSVAGSGQTLPLAPAIPAGLTVSGATASSLYVSWNPVNGASDYILDRGGTVVYTGSVSHFTDTGLASSTSYSYKVKSHNSAGESAFSAVVSGTTTGSVPSVVPAPITVSGATSSTLDVSWSAADGATSYKVYRAVAGGEYYLVKTLSGTSTTDTGLTSGTGYTYKVKAVNAVGDSGYSTPASGTTTGPKPPDWIDVHNPTDSSMQVSWSTVAGAVRYKAYRDIDSGFPSATECYSGSDTWFTDAGLLPNTTYYYRVKAVDSGAVESTYSEIRSNRTWLMSGSPPGTPASLWIYHTTESSLFLAWSSVGGANSYKLYRGPDIAYDGPSTSFGDEGLTPSTTYSYKISALNSAGESTPSSEVVGTTYAVASVPATPGDLSVQDAWDAGDNMFGVTLYWISVDVATSYQLFRSNAALGTYTQIYSGSNNGYSDSTLDISKTYYYKVKAKNLAGSSALSEPPLEVAAGQLIIIIE